MIMFELDPNGRYMMPAHFGPRTLPPKPSGWYHDVTAMTVAFVTDRDKLAAYLPPQYKVGEEAIVTVSYACNRDVDWLAGHGYNLVAVNAAARFDGEEDKFAGNFCLVMWENLTDPILTGREQQGIPKVYADIQDHGVIDGQWHTSASHFGHKFLDMSIDGLREPTPEEIAFSEEAMKGKDNPLGWRYIPGVGGFGQALNEPTTYPSENIISEGWVGEGSVEWQHLTWEQNPTQCHIVNALADLPVLGWLPALVTRGSANLVLPDRLPRAIR